MCLWVSICSYVMCVCGCEFVYVRGSHVFVYVCGSYAFVCVCGLYMFSKSFVVIFARVRLCSWDVCFRMSFLFVGQMCWGMCSWVICVRLVFVGHVCSCVFVVIFTCDRMCSWVRYVRMSFMFVGHMCLHVCVCLHVFVDHIFLYVVYHLCGRTLQRTERTATHCNTPQHTAAHV